MKQQEEILKIDLGIILAGTTSGYKLELYKTKIKTEEFNNCILNLVNLLNKNGEKYDDTFPIKIDTFEFTIEGEKLEQWKKQNKLDISLDAKECFEYFLNKYDITFENIEDQRKAIGLIYEIKKAGYGRNIPYTICKSISINTMLEIYENNKIYPGISIEKVPIRTYNLGSLASHIIGYIGKINEEELKLRKDEYNLNSYIGKSGIEYTFEEYLKGTDGKMQIDMSINGTQMGEYITEEASAGCDIILTIDANLQKVAEDSLALNIEKVRDGSFGESYDTNAGALAVVNVNTGEILAMASYPNYEPTLMYNGISQNKYNEYLSNRALFNRAIQGAYPPGSIFKMVTAIAGLETGAITKDEKIFDTGVYNKYNMSWKCWYYTDYHTGHGYVNVESAIQKSCNFFFYEVGDRLGIDALDRYARFFGLGSKTNVELSSESSGNLASKENRKNNGGSWNPGDTLNAAIGQGDNAFTPLQMARYLSILVNGGKQIDLTLVKSIVRPDNTEVDKTEINAFLREKLGITKNNFTEDLDISDENLNTVLSAMRSVALERGGTAYSVFKDFDVEIGGKTGSAQAPHDEVHAWFAAFAPYENPEIAIIVLIENGGHGNYSAQVVKDILTEYLGRNYSDVYENNEITTYLESI